MNHPSAAFSKFRRKEFEEAYLAWLRELRVDAMQWHLQKELVEAREDLLKMDMDVDTRERTVRQLDALELWFGIEKTMEVRLDALSEPIVSMFGVLVHDDHLYITDGFNHNLQRIACDGTRTLKIGKKGKGPGEFWNPKGTAIIPWSIDGRRESLACCDYGNHRVELFSTDGEFITSFGQFGNGQDEFNGPYDLVASDDERLSIVDRCNHRIKRVSRKFQVDEITGGSCRKDVAQDDDESKRAERSGYTKWTRAAFEYPAGMWEAADGRQMISDRKHLCIEIRDGLMRPLHQVPDNIMPRNVTGDKYRMLVKDEVSNDIICMNHRGYPLCTFKAERNLLPVKNTSDLVELRENSLHFYRFKRRETISTLPVYIGEEANENEMNVLDIVQGHYALGRPGQGLEIINQIPPRKLPAELIFLLTDIWKSHGTVPECITEYVDFLLEGLEEPRNILYKKLLSMNRQEQELIRKVVGQLLDQTGILFDVFQNSASMVMKNTDDTCSNKFFGSLVRAVSRWEDILLEFSCFVDQTRRKIELSMVAKEAYVNAVGDVMAGGDYERAFGLWEGLLKIDPANDSIHKKLKAISSRAKGGLPEEKET